MFYKATKAIRLVTLKTNDKMKISDIVYMKYSAGFFSSTFSCKLAFDRKS